MTLADSKTITMDISHRAVNFGRILDRLSPGTYTIEVVKDSITSMDWKITINRAEFVQRVSLSNKSYLPE